MKNKSRLLDILLLQSIVIIYTINSIIAKFATGTQPFTVRFFLFYGAEVCVLGIYAICWQQMIKRFELSVAYANRSMAILWTALWAVLIFHEMLTVKQIVGIILVVTGTVIVNRNDKKEDGSFHKEEGRTAEEGT